MTWPPEFQSLSRPCIILALSASYLSLFDLQPHPHVFLYDPKIRFAVQSLKVSHNCLLIKLKVQMKCLMKTLFDVTKFIDFH